jgi:hypothetical protein
MNGGDSSLGSWGQLLPVAEAKPGQQGALPPDIEAHIRALTAPDSEAVPAETLSWVRAKFREYVAGREALDEVMNLKPSAAQRDWRTVARDKARNAWLVRAFELIDGPSEYQRCRKLSEHIFLFQEAFWPGLEHCDFPQEDTTGLRLALFFAFKCGEGDVPVSWKTLMKIVREAPVAPATCPILPHVHADTYD